MRTRLLETQDVVRGAVNNAELIETGKTSLLLKTSATLYLKKPINSADPEMFKRKAGAAIHEAVEGRLRIDVWADNIVRIRYAPGRAVPENATPMLVGKAGTPKCRVNASQRPQIKTAAITLSVDLDPFRIQIADASGQSIADVGGPERDFFLPWDEYSTGVNFAVDSAGNVGGPIASETFGLAPGQAIYGMGERFIRLNKVGQTIDLNQSDALGVMTQRTYKNIPFFITTQGYGIFFNHSSLMTLWCGSMCAAEIQAALEDDFLDYFIITGDIRTILSSYTDLTGKGRIPPKWSFGYWQSKISYKSAEEVLDIARNLRKSKIPCDVICLDTHWYKNDWFCDLQFSQERFPDPKALMKELAGMGFKISLWQLPYIPTGSQYYDDLAKIGGFVKKPDGSIYETKVGFGMSSIIDFTNPQAVRVYQEYLARLFRLGAKVIKTDFGEGAPTEGVVYHDGTPAHRMHNLYPLLYNMAASEVTRRETGGSIVWARSAWASSQRFPLHWGGDSSATWENLGPQLAGGLSFGLSGFQFWSQDIGGFLGKADDALMIRWMQASMFISHSRIHGMGDRELYKFSPKVLRICRDYIQLRYRLLPYIESQAHECVKRSLPMMRAMVVDFQDDPATWNISDQFLFGDSILVAPMFSPESSRRVYLPRGAWANWWTGRRTIGPAWVTAKPNLQTLPLWIREGAVVPLGPSLNYVDEKPIDNLELRIAPYQQPGRTRVTIPVNGRPVTITYTRIGTRHRVSATSCDIPITAKLLGGPRTQVQCG